MFVFNILATVWENMWQGGFLLYSNFVSVHEFTF